MQRRSRRAPEKSGAIEVIENQPGTANYDLAVPPGVEPPIALMFYDSEKKALRFARMPGVGLQEFIAIMRQFLPDYGK